MKLDETTIDDEKENTCNGNNILEKPISKASAETVEDLTDSNSNPPGVGDLLVVDPNASRHEEENGIHNGSRADDSTSVSSSSSNFPLVDFQQDDLSDEDMTLRISDEEDISEPVNNESGSYYTSSPFPKPEEKNHEDCPSTEEEATNSETKDSNELNTQTNSDSENKNTSENSAEKDIPNNADKDTSNEKSEDSKSDDLENLISDLTEQSKTILETESKSVTVTELREEVEEFIKYHDNDEMETENETENKTENTTNSDSQPSEKSDETNDETKAVESENKESEPEESTSVEETEIKEQEKDVESSKNEIEPSTSESEEKEITIADDSETKNTNENIPKEAINEVDENKEEESKENTVETISDEKEINAEKSPDPPESIPEGTDSEEKPSDEQGTVDEINSETVETKESDSPACQKTDVSEQTEPEKPETTEPELEKTAETEETETENTNETANSPTEENESQAESLLMEVDYSERETESVENKSDSVDSIIIEDDVEMTEDFETKKEDVKTEEKSAFDALKEMKEEDVKNIIKSDTKEEIKGEETRTLKRSLDTSSEETQDAKKVKVNKIEKETPYVRLDAFRDFMSRKKVSTLTRAELEDFCIQKIGEVVNQTSKLGELNRKIMQQETRYEALQAKYTALNKQIRDLEVVHTRVLQEVRMKVKENNVEVSPVKITRSVGLQVSLQLVVGRNRPNQPPVPIQTQTSPQPDKTWNKRKVQQRTLPETPPMPPPSRPPLRSPQQKGIKTILPKVPSPTKTYPPADKKDPNPSVLETYLQNPTPGTSKSPARDASAKVIDLTDEDDTQKATPNTNTIRVVSPQQLQTSTAVTSTSLPRLTYLVQGNNGQGQQVLLATSTAPTRPGQVRSTLMFKPVSSVQPGQRLNLVRPPSVPGVTVLSPSGSGIRAGQPIRFATPVQSPRPQVRASAPLRHPAPLPGPPPMQPSQPNWKAMPPKPTLKISRVGDGIVLSWRMQSNKDMSLYEEIGSYQLYAYQETNSAPSTDMWRKVGDVKALALPMACTLTQFTDGNKYHFAVRAVDVKSRVGPFSQPEQIALP